MYKYWQSFVFSLVTFELTISGVMDCLEYGWIRLRML